MHTLHNSSKTSRVQLIIYIFTPAPPHTHSDVTIADSKFLYNNGHVRFGAVGFSSKTNAIFSGSNYCELMHTMCLKCLEVVCVA